MRIIIGADIVPTKSNFDCFTSGNISDIVDKSIISILKDSDERIFNLEVPLVDKETPIDKCGPNLIAPTGTIKGIKKLNPTLLTLANNHIMDQGTQGLNSTIDTLRENGISYVGAGNNLSNAQKPFVIEKNGIRVGVYACAEHEFSIAGNNSPGANPFDPFESLDHIAELKSSCNYVIVLYHGGKEHYRYPSPNLQKICRKICEKGADLVVCQHSHCIGCEEKYNGSTIVYGQGNFLFDHSESEFWQTSLLIDAEISDTMNISYIPVCKNGNGVRKATESEGTKILSDFSMHSGQIKSDIFVEEQYLKFAEQMIGNYIGNVCGNSFLFRCINKICGHRLKQRISKQKRLALINFIECEAHRELFLRVLKDTDRCCVNNGARKNF